DAWVAGVGDVSTRGLHVRPWARDAHRRPSPPRPTDAAIAEAIELAAIYDPRVEPAEITPWVSGGVVTLTGRVETAKEKQAAEEIAAGTVGVRGVANLLVVQARRPASDRRLARRIEAALQRNALIESRKIDVHVEDGV